MRLPGELNTTSFVRQLEHDLCLVGVETRLVGVETLSGADDGNLAGDDGTEPLDESIALPHLSHFGLCELGLWACLLRDDAVSLRYDGVDFGVFLSGVDTFFSDRANPLLPLEDFTSPAQTFRPGVFEAEPRDA